MDAMRHQLLPVDNFEAAVKAALAERNHPI
jgi:hypothetical protein